MWVSMRTTIIYQGVANTLIAPIFQVLNKISIISYMSVYIPIHYKYIEIYHKYIQIYWRYLQIHWKYIELHYQYYEIYYKYNQNIEKEFKYIIVMHLSLGVPATQGAEGGPRSDTWNLCHGWWMDPSGLSIGHGTLSVEDASYP
jgi:hypothetical protein